MNADLDPAPGVIELFPGRHGQGHGVGNADDRHALQPIGQHGIPRRVELGPGRVAQAMPRQGVGEPRLQACQALPALGFREIRVGAETRHCRGGSKPTLGQAVPKVKQQFGRIEAPPEIPCQPGRITGEERLVPRVVERGQHLGEHRQALGRRSHRAVRPHEVRRLHHQGRQHQGPAPLRRGRELLAQEPPRLSGRHHDHDAAQVERHPGDAVEQELRRHFHQRPVPAKKMPDHPLTSRVPHPASRRDGMRPSRSLVIYNAATRFGQVPGRGKHDENVTMKRMKDMRGRSSAAPLRPSESEGQEGGGSACKADAAAEPEMECIAVAAALYAASGPRNRDGLPGTRFILQGNQGAGFIRRRVPEPGSGHENAGHRTTLQGRHPAELGPQFVCQSRCQHRGLCPFDLDFSGWTSVTDTSRSTIPRSPRMAR